MKTLEQSSRNSADEKNRRMALVVASTERDITERQCEHNARNVSEERYRRLFESAKDGILILDAETGVVVDVNPYLLDLVGRSYEHCLGKALWELGFLKDMVASREAFETLKRENYVRYEDLPLEASDGRRMDVEVVSNVYREGNKNVIQCNIRDITERKVRESRQTLLIKVLQVLNCPSGIRLLIKDILGLIKDCVGMEAVGIRLQKGDDFPYYETRGFPGSFLQVERRLCSYCEDGSIVRDEHSQPVLECMCGNVIRGRTDPSWPFFTKRGSFWSNGTTDLLASTTEKDRQARTRNRCNAEGYESVALIPLRSGDEVIGLLQMNDHRKGMFTIEMIEFFEEIGASIGIAVNRGRAASELRRMNLRLKASMDELHQTQQKVIQQERLSALGQMASGIAHDFNNVLMPIIGFSELMLSNPTVLEDEEEARHMIGMILSAGQDARQIVRRVGQIYTSEASKYGLVDLAKVLESVVSLTMPKWKEEMNAKGASIEIATEFKDVPLIKGNASELREAVINLIFNAVDAMPDGGRIVLTLSSENKMMVVLEVSDTGIGMDQAISSHCVEPFFTTKGVRGTGLGLSMVCGIVERHGGGIEIDSKPGAGTAIRMRFPIPVETDTPEDHPEENHEPLVPLRVLVIDDEARSRALIERILKADGHAVRLAEGGQEGLEALRQGEAFDLVITDRAMPLVCGDVIAAEVARERPGTPVIMITGFGDIMKDAGESSPGITRIMTKPVTSAELRCAVKRVMDPAAQM